MITLVQQSQDTCRYPEKSPGKSLLEKSPNARLRQFGVCEIVGAGVKHFSFFLFMEPWDSIDRQKYLKIQFPSVYFLNLGQLEIPKNLFF